jgi:chemotaxis protein MotA
MADPASVPHPVILDSIPEPVIYIEKPRIEIDLATVIGLIASLALIVLAVWMEGTGANFFNLPSVFIVIFGTVAVTSISYTWEELSTAWDTIKNSVIRQTSRLRIMATQIVDLSVLARKKGLLSLTSYDHELSKEPFLKQALQLVTDGFQAPDIEHFLQQEIETGMERQRKLAGILRRASEIAPGMGLIGTLVGLVQMLSQLDNPATIGPAMAIALLTTFYGAVISTVVLAPLAVKIERNAGDDALLKTIIIAGAVSISRQENPRRLEIILNSILPPSSKIRYFD